MYDPFEYVRKRNEPEEDPYPSPVPTGRMRPEGDDVPTDISIHKTVHEQHAGNNTGPFQHFQCRVLPLLSNLVPFIIAQVKRTAKKKYARRRKIKGEYVQRFRMLVKGLATIVPVCLTPAQFIA